MPPGHHVAEGFFATALLTLHRGKVAIDDEDPLPKI